MYRLPLWGTRVLDLADRVGAYAGRLLGDMGAEVIKIEAPLGDSLRGSPVFQFLNANKYGCVLDVGHSRGCDLLLRLVELSDVAIAPADAVDVDALRTANATLIVVLLPADASATSCVAAAGAVGVALWDRRRTGRGGVLDVAPGEAGVTGLDAATALRLEAVSTLDGVVELPAPHWRMSETPTHIRLPAPQLGEHNQYVFRELLGLSEEEVAALEAEGITGRVPNWGMHA